MRTDTQGVVRGGPHNRPLTEMTREELLWDFRTSEESAHRSMIWRFSEVFYCMPSARDVKANLPLHLSVDDYYEICNKSVPVYINNCSKWQQVHIVLHNYIYRRWFRPYRSEIDYNRFICKFIFPQELPDDEVSSSPSNIRSLIGINMAICNEVKSLRTSYMEYRALGHTRLSDDITGIPNTRHHVLQPLFRALFILVPGEQYNNQDSRTVGELPVYLVRTGVEEGLSAPITFDLITTAISHIEPGCVVQVTLQTAIDFVIYLEAREAVAFDLRPDPVAEWKPDEEDLRIWRQLKGNEPLIGPSSQWVDTERYPQWLGAGQQDDSDYMTGIEERQFRIEAGREAQREARKVDLKPDSSIHDQ